MFHDKIVGISQKKEVSTANITTTYYGHNLTFNYTTLYAIAINGRAIPVFGQEKLPDGRSPLDNAVKFDNNNALSLLELDKFPAFKQVLEKAYQHRDDELAPNSQSVLLSSRSDVDKFFQIVQETNGTVHMDRIEENKDAANGNEIVIESFSIIAKYNDANFIVTLIVTSNID